MSFSIHFRTLFVALSLASTARAQTPPALPSPHGMELAFRFGAATFTDSSSTPFSSATASRLGTLQPGVGLQIDLGYRLHPRVAVGLRVGLQRLGSGEAPGYFSRNGAVTFGVYGRYAIPLVRSFRHELWVGLGVDLYSSFSRTLTPMTPTGPTTPTTMDATRLDYGTLGLPLHVGVDFGIAPHVSLGPVVGATLWVPYERCTSGYDRTVGAPTSACQSEGLIPNALLFVGINLRLHP